MSSPLFHYRPKVYPIQDTSVRRNPRFHVKLSFFGIDNVSHHYCFHHWQQIPSTTSEAYISDLMYWHERLSDYKLYFQPNSPGIRRIVYMIGIFNIGCATHWWHVKFSSDENNNHTYTFMNWSPCSISDCTAWSFQLLLPLQPCATGMMQSRKRLKTLYTRRTTNDHTLTVSPSRTPRHLLELIHTDFSRLNHCQQRYRPQFAVLPLRVN